MTWRARWRGVVCEDDNLGYKDEEEKGKDLFLDVADGGNDDDLSDDYDDVG